MLTIRNAQLEALRLSRVPPYREKVREALFDLITPQRLLLSHGQLDRVIDLGMLRAKKYGFSTEKEVFNLITAMVVFGPDFDTGPLKHHFTRSLNTSSRRLSAFRADDLFKEVRNRLDQNPDFKVGDLKFAAAADANSG